LSLYFIYKRTNIGTIKSNKKVGVEACINKN